MPRKKIASTGTSAFTGSAAREHVTYYSGPLAGMETAQQWGATGARSSASVGMGSRTTTTPKRAMATTALAAPLAQRKVGARRPARRG